MPRSPHLSPPSQRRTQKRASVKDVGLGKLGFAIKFNMLTDEEIQGIKDGKLGLRDYQIFNRRIDASYTGGYSGETVKIYPGRREDILAQRLLGVKEKE